MRSPEDMRNQLLEAVRRTPSPPRRVALRRLLARMAGAIGLDVALFFAVGGVDAGARPRAFLGLVVAGSTAIALAAGWGAFTRAGSMLGRRSRSLVALALATPIALFAWLLLCRAFALGAPPPGSPAGRGCLPLTLAFAAVPLLILTIGRRELDPLHPGLAGAARGVAVGALASVLVTLWCPSAAPAHVAAGHLLPLVMLALGGAWLGARHHSVSRAARR